MLFDRRNFLAQAGVLASGIVGLGARGPEGQSAGTPNLPPEGEAAPRKLLVTDAADGAELQDVMYREAGNDCCVRIDPPRETTCLVREDSVGDERSIHA